MIAEVCSQNIPLKWKTIWERSTKEDANICWNWSQVLGDSWNYSLCFICLKFSREVQIYLERVLAYILSVGKLLAKFSLETWLCNQKGSTWDPCENTDSWPPQQTYSIRVGRWGIRSRLSYGLPVNRLQRSTSLPRSCVRWPPRASLRSPRLLVFPWTKAALSAAPRAVSAQWWSRCRARQFGGASEERDTGKEVLPGRGSVRPRGHEQTFPGWETWACLKGWGRKLLDRKTEDRRPVSGAPAPRWQRTGTPQWERSCGSTWLRWCKFQSNARGVSILLKWLPGCSCEVLISFL